jgi:hypothetical protein
MNFVTWNAVMTAAKASGVHLEPRTRISAAIIKASLETRPRAHQERLASLEVRR